MSTDAGGPIVTVVSLAIVAGTALGFGAVYPWVYWPALAACAAVSARALWSGGRSRLGHHRAVGAALGAVALAIAAQIVPLPNAIRGALSPAAERVMSASDLQHVAMLFASAGAVASTGSKDGAAPLSIDPAGSATALTFLVVLGAFMVGLAVHFARSGGPERMVLGVIGIGVVLAVVAIIQQAIFNGRIYGFWQPRSTGADPFGPFVNRNHFAGWMVMAVPVGLGYVTGLLARSGRSVRPGWHHWVLWLSSPAASRLILAAVAMCVLVGAAVLTLSRSGIASLLVAVLVVGLAIIRARSRRTRFAALGACFAVVVTALGWAGLNATLQRFADLEGTDLSGRVTVWRDTLAIVRDFPLVGSGLNTFATAVVSYETPDQPVLFTEAHNEYLQLASEGGLLVSLPAAAALAIFVVGVRRRLSERPVSQMTWWIRVGAVAGLLAIALQSSVEFSLQIPANAVLCSVLCAIALHREAAAPDRRNSSCA